METKQEHKGAIITLGAGILWGFSGCCSQYIFDNYTIPPLNLTVLRLVTAGLILVIMGFIKSGKSMLDIWKDRVSAAQLIIFSLIGLTLCQLSYMIAIQETNSGTATVLQYVGPVFIVIASCFLNHKLPSKKEIFSITLTAIGVFLIATEGNFHTMVITTKGLIWGLISAFALMFNNILPQKILEKYGSITVTGYAMLMGGIVLGIFSGSYKEHLSIDLKFILAFLGIAILGTVISFTAYLYGLSLCGPVKASMLSSIEPVSATVIMMLWLKVPLHPVTILGFAFIIITIIILTRPEKNPQ